MNLTQREYWLDLVKGLAIIGVVLQHSLQRTIYYFDKGDTFFLPAANDFVASVNMQWFFVVSGYIYYARRKQYLKEPKIFCRNKFIDLMIPYLILGPLIWFGKFTLSAYVKNQVGIDTLLNMFVTPIAFMWFIYVLFFIEIIVFMIDKATHIKYEVLLGVAFAMYVTILLLVGYGEDVFRRVPYFMFWYCLGGVFHYYKDFINARQVKLMTLGGVIWIVAWSLHIYLNSKSFNVIYTLGSVFFICLFFKRHCSMNRTNNLLNYLGNKTMYVYILNPIIINGLRQVLVKLHVSSITVNFFIFFFGALIIASLIGEIGKKFPPVGFVFTPRKYIIKKK